MKKILIFSLNYYPRFISGAEIAIKEITDRLSSNDFEFHLIALRFDSTLPRKEKLGNVIIHRIGFAKPNPNLLDLRRWPLKLNKPLYQILAFCQATLLNYTYHFDAIWAVMAHSAGIPAALYKLTHPKTKYYLSLQEGDTIEHIEKIMRPVWPLFIKSFRLADKIQAISNYLADWAKKYGVKSELIQIIPNGADTNDLNIDPLCDEVIKLKERLGKKSGDVFLINTARLVYQKANDDIIKALILLPKNIKLLLVGDGQEFSKLQQLALDLKLKDRVIFTGQVPLNEVTKYRLAADIFVGPSRSEGLGIAFLSAMASGLPVIATQEGGLADYIFDKKHNPTRVQTAWVVEKNSPKQIAKAVKDVLENKNSVSEITRNAKAIIIAEFNWESVAKRISNDFLA